MSAAGHLNLLSLHELLELTGAEQFDVSGAAEGFLLSAPAEADQGSVVVAWQRASLEEAMARGAGLLVVPEQLQELVADRPHLIVQDARLALARLSAAAKPAARPAAGIHPSAVVHPSATVAADAVIGPGCVIAAEATVGPGSVLGASCTLGERSSIGADCRLDAGVHLYHDVKLGNRVILQSGVVLGADGFGFAAGAAGAVRIEHLGRVELADDVEVGANSSIDRATLGVTSVGARTKIDNLVQIGHNVQIGTDCLITGQCAIGGSTVIGNRVTLAGNAAIADHVVIEDDAVIGALSGVNKRVPAGEFWFGIPALPQRQWIRRRYLNNRLEEIWAFVRKERGK